MSKGFLKKISYLLVLILTRDSHSKQTKNLQTEERNSSPTGIFKIILFLNHTYQSRLYRLQYT